MCCWIHLWSHFIVLTAERVMHIWPVKVQAVAIAKPPFIDARARYKRMRQLEKEENRCMQLATGRKTILRDKHDRKKIQKNYRSTCFSCCSSSSLRHGFCASDIIRCFILQIIQIISDARIARNPPQLEPSIWKLASHSDPPNWSLCFWRWMIHAVRITRVRKTQILWCWRRFTPTPVQCWRRAWETLPWRWRVWISRWLLSFLSQTIHGYGTGYG